MEKLTVTSPALKEGDWIPHRYSAYGEDLSPELRIEGLTEDAACLVVVMDDLGHPIQPGYNHWIAWNLPAVAVIPEGLPQGAIIEEPLHAEQGKAYGKHRYRGPRPPFNWNHIYRFTVYALDTLLHLPPDADKAAVLRAMEGHILQSGTLCGKYQRKHS